jgi:hypothetical protein
LMLPGETITIGTRVGTRGPRGTRGPYFFIISTA